MDWHLLRTVSRYLARNPPVHVLLRAFMGINTDELPGATEPEDEGTRRANFLDAFQAAGGQLH